MIAAADDRRMADETVLVTGASSGIGRATARLFAAEGWTVYATARRESDLDGLEDCRTDALDVTSGEAIDRVVGRIVAEEGSVGCLVNNAGYGQYGPVEDIPTDRLHRQFDVNVYGPHRLVRVVLPHMRERGEGTVVNVSSVSGRVSTPGSGAYSASKFALEALSDALRAEAGRFGVDVVLVEPGPVATAFRDRAEGELDGLDRRPCYEWVYDLFEDAGLLAGGPPLAVEPEAVATVVHDAACVADPDPRYPVGRAATYALYSRFLPDRLRDAVYRLVARLA
jgi:NAD(P)-dependent dehydrogenase (short-subunit alcohol dehydrogenase family)